MGAQQLSKFFVFIVIASDFGLNACSHAFHIKPDLPLNVQLTYTTAADEKFVQFSFELSIPDGAYGELSMRDLQVSYFFKGLPGGSVDNYVYFCDYARPELGNKTGVLGDIISLADQGFASKGIAGANYALVVTFASSWALEPGKDTRNIRVRVGYRDADGKLVNMNDTGDYSYLPPVYAMDYYLGRLALANQPNTKIEVALREDGRILYGVSPAEKVRLAQQKADEEAEAARQRAEAIAAAEAAEAERLAREAALRDLEAQANNGTTNHVAPPPASMPPPPFSSPPVASPPPPVAMPPSPPPPSPPTTSPPPSPAPTSPAPSPSSPPLSPSPPPSPPPQVETPPSAAGQLQAMMGMSAALIAIMALIGW